MPKQIILGLILTLLLGCSTIIPLVYNNPVAPALTPVAYTPTPGSAPILQLDPGGHMALIMDIAFTPDGRFLVSASNDKTVRVWDVQHPGAPRVIRGQVGEGNEGRISAMALSPDGRTLAVGGWMDKSTASEPCCGDIRLYDLATGRVLGLLRGHTNVVLSLAFSPDGQQLISGSGDFTAILWDVPNRTQLQRLEGHTDFIYGVAFTPDGQRVVTGSLDHDLRLWAVADGQLIARMAGHTDKVYAVAVAADGTIASGSDDHSIRLWDGHSGAFIKTLADQGTQVGSLSFSPDGQWLLSSCGSGGCSGSPQYIWSVATGQELRRYTGHDNIVLATAFAPAGNLVATAGGSNQEIHLWNPSTGELQQRLTGGGASTWAVGIAVDGSSIAWGNTWTQHDPTNGYGSVEYQLPLTLAGTPQLGSPTPLRAGTTWQRATPTFGTWSLRHTQGGNYGVDAILEILNAGQVQAKIERGSTDGYDHRAYTFTPDGNTIISGGVSGVLSAYTLAGKKQGDFVGHTGDIWAVAVAGDGRLLVSGSDDQTVRVWNVATRELLLTVFHKNPTQTPPPSPLPLTGEGGKNPTPTLPLTGEGENLSFPPVKGGLRGVEIGEWVAWTPQGYYASSPNGDKMVGWQINRGPDQTPDFIEAKQLRKRFYRPDILAQAIALGSAEQAVAQAPDAKFHLADLATQQPPKFQVLSPENGTETSSAQLDLVLNIPPQPQDTPLEQAKIYVNNSLVDGTQVALRLGKTSLPLQAGGQRKNYTINLQAGTNNIRVEVTNNIGTTTQELSVILKGRAEKVKGDLYLIAVGVSDYAANDLDLTYAAADATAFSQSIVQHTQGLYNQVHQTILVTDPGATAPTAAAIRAALEIPKQAKPEDTTILFFAGHGLNTTNHGYRFLPQDTGYNNGSLDHSTTVAWEDIQNTLTDTAGQRILFVDTCQSGAAFNSRLVKDTADSSILVFSATNETTTAQERPELSHGVFTYAILEGLDGKADLMPPDQHIMLKELDTYVSYRVTSLTEGFQIPTIHTPGGFADFEFARK